ncbi:hypothetical protein QHH03_20015 [Aphanizomenon sp. 202]|uniref:Transposase n=1 Tax=Dolichospermum heterosporum TAC447 TaxID=747523 RepID=A0ABY5LTJ0_9CYAN|nr:MULTISPECIES: hypothetical protein [Aphanizomenonaceae]MDK2411429.1 hypothetical protein [Aphanizomenon sp. 202]UUO15318.1 hypothetical protein NG743_25545 [Dolichospermum heterosporum TAC447]
MKINYLLKIRVYRRLSAFNHLLFVDSILSESGYPGFKDFQDVFDKLSVNS